LAYHGSVRPYARAVFEVARAADELERWQNDLNKIVALRQDSALAALLDNPRFRFEDKAKILSVKLDGVSPQALNLVYLLVIRGKLDMASGISLAYQRLMQSYRGVKTAQIITAVALDEASRDKLSQHLAQLLKSPVVLGKVEVDPGIIGGIVVRVDGKLLDGSTNSRLESLHREIGGAD
jgi:F-type H+-transporting ATPase subunit delta